MSLVGRLVGVGLLLLPFVGCSKPDAPTADAPAGKAAGAKPNILWIVWDCVRADHMSLYGYDKPTTPKLDKWAKQARVYDDCLSPAVASTSAYASMMTGLLPSVHGTDYRQKSLREDLTTAAEVLRERGYQTFMYSAHPDVTGDTHFDQGFDATDYPWNPQYRELAMEYVREKVPPGDMSSEVARKVHSGHISNWALTACGMYAEQSLMDWLSRRGGNGPYFALVIYTEAHRPQLPSMDYRRLFMSPEQAERSKKVERIRPKFWSYTFGAPAYDDAELAIMAAMYDATIRELDDSFADLIHGLTQHGQLDDTVVILTADHGDLFGEHHVVGHDFALYQPLLHVPLVAYDPAIFDAGRDSHPVSNMDLFATLLDLSGGEGRYQTDQSISLLSPRDKRARFAEYPAYHSRGLKITAGIHPDFDPTPWQHTLQAVIDRPFKLIRASNGARELYNLATDPTESRNLAMEDPDRADQLNALMQDALGDLKDDINAAGSDDEP